MVQQKSRNRASVTLKDVAAALGVSRTTVSNAYNRPDQLSDDLRDKVIRKAKAMGYMGPNPVARQLRTGRTATIGLVFSDGLTFAFEDPAAIAFLQGVAAVCERNGTGLTIVPAEQESAAEIMVRQAAVDGYIVYCLPRTSPIFSRVLDTGLPVVLADYGDFPGIATVGIDDRAACREATQHLLDLGHRRFGVITLEFSADGYTGPVGMERRAGAAFDTAEARLRGYEDALSRAGIALTSDDVEERPANSEAAGYDAARVLLSHTPRPTALLCMSDRQAVGAIHAADNLGLKVPDDVSIVGFDDVPIAAHVRPSLTTVHQPLAEKGQVAADLLLAGARPESRRLLPTRLVVRETTAPPA